MFILNPGSGIPIYRQLIGQIRRMVASGQLKPGDSLPSVREIAVGHAVNPMTISKAYSLLEAEGLLERQRGKAMTIAMTNTDSESKKARLERLQDTVDQLAVEAQQLGLGSEDVINVLRAKMEKQDVGNE